MKKLLAIVISLIMVFSLASAAFAYDVAPGQIYFGPKGNSYANPGETATVTINFSADAFESDGYPTDGVLHIPFQITAGNDTIAPLSGYNLTADAIAAGVSFSEDTVLESGVYIAGEVLMPSSLLYNQTNIDIFTVDLAISAEWEVVDYVATEDIAVMCAAGADLYAPAYITTETEDYIEVGNLITDDCVIQATPYQPTTMEKLVEKLKGYAAAFVNILIVGLQYVLSNYLQPAPWAQPAAPVA